MRLQTTRDISKKECPWLDEDVKKDTNVFEYSGHTYGCISPAGTPVSFKKGSSIFFELPINALKKIR